MRDAMYVTVAGEPMVGVVGYDTGEVRGGVVWG